MRSKSEILLRQVIRENITVNRTNSKTLSLTQAEVRAVREFTKNKQQLNEFLNYLAAGLGVLGALGKVLETETGRKVIIALLKAIRLLASGATLIGDVPVSIIDSAGDKIESAVGFNIPDLQGLWGWVKLLTPAGMSQYSIDKMIEYIEGMSSSEWSNAARAASTGAETLSGYTHTASSDLDALGSLDDIDLSGSIMMENKASLRRRSRQQVNLTNADIKALHEIADANRRLYRRTQGKVPLVFVKKSESMNEWVIPAAAAVLGLSVAEFFGLITLLFTIFSTKAGQRLLVLILKAIRYVNGASLRVQEIGNTNLDSVTNWLTGKVGVHVPVAAVLDWLKLLNPAYYYEMTLDELIEFIEGTPHEDWEEIVDQGRNNIPTSVDDSEGEGPSPADGDADDASALPGRGDGSDADGPGDADGMHDMIDDMPTEEIESAMAELDRDRRVPPGYPGLTTERRNRRR